MPFATLPLPPFANLLRNAVLGAALAVSAGAASAAPAQLLLGTVNWIGYGPFYVAQSLDLFKKYDLSVKLQVFSDPALIPTALAGGSIQGGMVTYDQVIGKVAQGFAQKVVMPIDYSYGGDAIVASADIGKVADFKGRKVGFAQLSPSDFLLSYALKTAGLSEKDIVPVNMTPEAVPAAMASGRMPVGVTYEPSLSQVLGQKDGKGGKKYRVVFSSREAPGLIADVLVFDEKFIKSNPKEIAGVMRAYLDGMAYMKSHPEESAKIIGKFLGIPAKDVKAQLAGVRNPTLAEMPASFRKAKETTSFYASGEIIAGLLKAKGQIDRIPPTEATMDAQFVTQLANSPQAK